MEDIELRIVDGALWVLIDGEWKVVSSGLPLLALDYIRFQLASHLAALPEGVLWKYAA